jgi:hypothetical protein
MLWDRVLLMLKCWSILVHLKIMVGFKNAIATLERLMVASEQIELHLKAMLAIVAPESQGNVVRDERWDTPQVSSIFQFQPP